MILPANETELLKQNYYTASGTVLKRKAGLKGGQSLLLFLKGFGIIWVTAPSSSAKNRFGGASEPMVWSVFTLYKSPNRFYVKSAEVKEDFLSVRTTPVKLATAIELYKNISKLLYAEHENDEALKLLWNCMFMLDKGVPAEAVKFRFYWRLLRQLGIAPSLTHCVSCGAEFKAETFAAMDGLVCRQCAAGGREIAKDKLLAMQKAALLTQEDFLQHASETDSSLFAKESEYLISFFAVSR